MTRIYEGSYDGRNLRVAVVASRFNETIARSLLEGALDCLRRHGVSEQDITTVWVPGAFELPAAVRRLAASKEVDAIVTVGAVIRGETAHFEYVAGHAARGIGELALEYDIPVTFGVLTTENVQQAADRAGGKLGNKGFEAAMAALEMANLFASLPKSLPEI
ncbi:MAG: 6,7-dimethyl-8-ribityllumazine synthase [Actinomycetota bacterium]|jgi:6,7-dimethyl-8-ribityllumazine synthase|nr:6,7-dimethyl-8-ribityllumazine synthase [Actinomycetota bacterium]